MRGLCVIIFQPRKTKPMLYAVLFFQRWQNLTTKNYKKMISDFKFRVRRSDIKDARMMIIEDFQQIGDWRDMAQCLENCGQFIGLKDKNGKDIYEGDIIKTINNNFGVIVKKDHCFEVTVSENQSSLYRADWIEQSEILGNIFDNPNLISELLKSDGKKL